jgi:hypothetical protein
MEDADLTDGDLFSDEVKINLHMLGALVLNEVVGEVHGTYVVAVDERTPWWRCLEFQQQLAQLGGLDHTVGDSAVLGLRTGAEDDGLPLGGSGYQVVSQKHRVAWSRAVSVWTTDPVSVSVDGEVGGARTV